MRYFYIGIVSQNKGWDTIFTGCSMEFEKMPSIKEIAKDFAELQPNNTHITVLSISELSVEDMTALLKEK